MKLALTHASSLLAEVILEQLAESGLAPDSLVLLDGEDQYGGRLAYAGTHLNVQNQYGYDYEDLDAVFLLAQDDELESMLVYADCAVIGHAMDSAMDAPLLDLSVADGPLSKGLNRIPSAETATLLTVLGPMMDQFAVQSVQVVNVLSAALFGQQAVASLAAQTVSLLNSRDAERGPFDLQLAFNMLPQATDNSLDQELQKCLGADVLVSQHSIIAAALHGMVQSVSLTFNDAVETGAVERLLEAVDNVRIEREPVSPFTHCRHGTSMVIYDLCHPQKDAKRLHFWIIADSIRNGLVQNYLKVKDILLNSYL